MGEAPCVRERDGCERASIWRGLDAVPVKLYAAYCEWRPALIVSRGKVKGVKTSRYHDESASAGMKKGEVDQYQTRFLRWKRETRLEALVIDPA